MTTSHTQKNKSVTLSREKTIKGNLLAGLSKDDNMARTHRYHISKSIRRIRTLEADCYLADKTNSRTRSRIHANDDLYHALRDE